MKELFIAAHEALIEVLLESHPWADWDEAYEACSDEAYLKLREDLANRAYQARQQPKEEG